VSPDKVALTAVVLLSACVSNANQTSERWPSSLAGLFADLGGAPGVPNQGAAGTGGVAGGSAGTAGLAAGGSAGASGAAGSGGAHRDDGTGGASGGLGVIAGAALGGSAGLRNVPDQPPAAAARARRRP
jgi:hypothetical protein